MFKKTEICNETTTCKGNQKKNAQGQICRQCAACEIAKERILAELEKSKK